MSTRWTPCTMRGGESDSRRGIVLFAPCDIDIRRDPLRTRQPDLFIFLHGRDDVGALEDLLEQPVIEMAPDITIEILSKDETRRARAAKIDDYRRIGVKECWIISPQAQTVEVLRLSPEGTRTVGIYKILLTAYRRACYEAIC